MKSRLLCLSLALLLPSSLAVAQDNGTTATASGVVILSAYNRASALPKTDSLGYFTFYKQDKTGRAPRTFWKYDAVKNKWVEANQSASIPTELQGKTDLTAVRENSLIKEIFWKNNDGSIWCLSAVSKPTIPFEKLNNFWNSINQVVRSRDKYGNAGSWIKVKLYLQYKP